MTICLDMYIVHTYTRWCSPSCKLVGLSPITNWIIDMSSINQLLSQVINELHRHESALNPNNSQLFLGEINLFFWFQLRYHLGVRFWRQEQLKNLSRYREEVTGGEIFRTCDPWDILGIRTWVSVGIYDGIYHYHPFHYNDIPLSLYLGDNSMIHYYHYNHICWDMRYNGIEWEIMCSNRR